MPELVAEVKTRSPYGFVSPYCWDEIFEYAACFGDIVSVHTDPRWGGSFSLVRRAVRQTRKPILAKGIHRNDDDIQRALDAGATWALVVGRKPSEFLTPFVWHEPLSLAEMDSKYGHVVWNQRDLATGLRKSESFVEARSLHSGWLCQASMISSPDDVHPSADGILVGEHLLSYIRGFRKS